jgi:hypothetical protein
MAMPNVVSGTMTERDYNASEREKLSTLSELMLQLTK